MIPKILGIPDQSKNSKHEDLNKTTIYNQFQLNDEIETNQNPFNRNNGQKNKLKRSGTEMNFDKKQLS